jgi:3-deoxy-D-manno-octulosonate 8-phosphate phosphatase KdsC-like HAD superfamily phosphatase
MARLRAMVWFPVILTGRESEITRRLCCGTEYHGDTSGVADKATRLKAVAEQYQCPLDEVAFPR